MFIFRIIIIIILVLPFLAAFPVESQSKQDHQPQLDSAEYPDLTNGLSDAEVESTLNGLSLEDLNALNKLLDDAGNGPFDLEASLRGHHRQTKKRYEDLDSVDEELDPVALSSRRDDSCHDDDEEKESCSQKPKCAKKPSCAPKKGCSSTRKCATQSCKGLDGLLNMNLDTGKHSGRSKVKFRKMIRPQEECDPEDTMCLQRNRERAKQRGNMQDLSDLSIDHNQDSNNMDSIEQLAVDAHQDQSNKIRKELDNWQSKDDSSSDVFNFNQYKIPNVDEFKDHSNVANEAVDDKRRVRHDDELKQTEVDEMPYERHNLGREAHVQLHQEEKADEEDLEDNIQMNAPPQLSQESVKDELEAPVDSMSLALENTNDNMAANDGDSFIEKNARDPVRYVIQTDDGFIQSENEPGMHRLRTDKQNSEMLNYVPSYETSDKSQIQSKRTKRDNNRKTDDAPENTNESYLKKLMDSFPRDQGSQSNLKMAIREVKRAHLRVKRS